MSKIDIAILGSMGSGKSSVSKALADKIGFGLYEESFKSNPFLEKYYKDLRAYAFINQMWFLNEKASQHVMISRNPNSTIQDSPIQSSLVFSTAQYNLGLLNKHEFRLLRDIYSILSKDVNPDHMVYLDTDVDVILDRIKLRNRVIETEVDESYIRAGVCALDNLSYEKRYIRVDGNQGIADVIEEITEKCGL